MNGGKTVTIEEQKKLLSNKLKMVSLFSSEDHKKLIWSFTQAKHGSKIADYLKSKAWQDDNDRNTKVFLIKDIEKNEIAYFFSVNCGILYNELDGIKLNEDEKKLYQRYLNATIKAHRSDLSEEQKEQAYEEWAGATDAFNNSELDTERITQLINFADEKAQEKEDKRELFEGTDEEVSTMRVKETFPAIDIKFLCRNSGYDPGIKTDFRLGVYVFWEMIVPHLLMISEYVGCKYIYLFAADLTDTEPDYMPLPFYDQNYDPYDEDDDADIKKKRVLKLVEYYQNELKFKPVNNFKILKPNFERSCYTLIQEVNNLQTNREKVWQSHMPENYSECSE